MWIYVIGTDREQIAYIIRVREALRSAQKEGTRRRGHTCGWSSPVSPAKLCRRSSPLAEVVAVTNGSPSAREGQREKEEDGGRKRKGGRDRPVFYICPGRHEKERTTPKQYFQLEPGNGMGWELSHYLFRNLLSHLFWRDSIFRWGTRINKFYCSKMDFLICGFRREHGTSSCLTMQR
jgi:hypothetical protein